MENVRDFFNLIGMPSLLYIDDLISLVVEDPCRSRDMKISEWYYKILRNLGPGQILFSLQRYSIFKKNIPPPDTAAN